MACNSEMEVIDNSEENTADDEAEGSSSSLRILSPPPNPYSCRKFEGSHHCVNEYIGYEPPNGVTHLSERIPIDQITSEQFFENYVLKRRPAVFSGQLTDPSWAAYRWTNDYLIDNAGKTIVRVEKRHTDVNSTRGTFGAKEDMEYSKFLRQLADGNENLYMTTQDMERDEEDLDEYGMPQAVAAEPLRTLRKDFPIRPTLLGNLIPYQLSLWQGTSKHGSSSGLHHDFHDNLYVLLRGRKTFRLFPPSAVGLLRPAGTITKVHKNGLIVYAFRDNCNVVNIRADGVPLAFIARRKRDEAETELAEAEDDLLELRERENSMVGSKVKLMDEKKRLRSLISDCEDRIDDAIAESIRYGDVSDDEDEVISISDDDDDDVKDKTVDDDDDAKEPAAKQRRLDNSESPSKSCEKEKENKNDSLSNSTANEQQKKMEGSSNSFEKGKEENDTSLENNFCTVRLPAVEASDEEFTSFLAELYEKETVLRRNTELVTSEITESINIANDSKIEEKSVECGLNGDIKLTNADISPSITDNGLSKADSKGAKPGLKDSSNKTFKTPELPSTFGCIIVNLKPGEMLYLPASWFHEVTSYNDELMTNESYSDNKVENCTVKNSTETVEQKSDEITDELSTVSSQSFSESTRNDSVEVAASNSGKNEGNLPETLETDPKNTNVASVDENNACNADQSSSISKSEVDKDSQLLRCMTDRGHLAFNYWMYPPDGSSFKKPYEGEFWPRRWYELETLRCTMGLGGRWSKRNEGVVKEKQLENVKACSSHVINIDSDDSDGELNEINDSDCFPTDKHVSSDGEVSNDSWSYDDDASQQRHRTQKQDSCILLNDSTSVCEIVDEGDDSEDEINSADRSELDSSFPDSIDDTNNSKNEKKRSTMQRGSGQAIYVDLDSDDSRDVDAMQKDAHSADDVRSANKSSSTLSVPAKDPANSKSIAPEEPAEVPLDADVSKTELDCVEAVADAVAVFLANSGDDKVDQSSTSAEIEDISAQVSCPAVPDILSGVTNALNKSDSTDADEDKNLEKLLDENDDDNLDEVAVDDKLLDL